MKKLKLHHNIIMIALISIFWIPLSFAVYHQSIYYFTTAVFIIADPVGFLQTPIWGFFIVHFCFSIILIYYLIKESMR